MGKSTPPRRPHPHPPDHPHVRGEKDAAESERQPSRGSSPRAWGKDYETTKDEIADRIIPTCVGKRTPATLARHPAPDHPHVRGEKAAARHSIMVVVGSSPRAWGKGTRGASALDRGRIIPTCVGKRLRLVPCVPWRSDHPHVRGEKHSQSSIPSRIAGSSPRAWGKGAQHGRG